MVTIQELCQVCLLEMFAIIPDLPTYTVYLTKTFKTFDF